MRATHEKLGIRVYSWPMVPPFSLTCSLTLPVLSVYELQYVRPFAVAATYLVFSSSVALSLYVTYANYKLGIVWGAQFSGLTM